jgi:hypothetical protein
VRNSKSGNGSIATCRRGEFHAACPKPWIPAQSRTVAFPAGRSQAHRGHTCPGGDLDSTHSADLDYPVLPRGLFELKARSFDIAVAGEQDGPRVLRVKRKYLKPAQRIFVEGIAPIDVCSLIEARRGWST